MAQFFMHSSTGLKRLTVNRKNQQKALSLLSLTALSACGGSSTQTPTPAPAPAPPPASPTPDFTESPTGTFTARDDSDGLTLSEATSSSDLTVIGKEGNDTINTGTGNDTITGAGGNDTVTAGGGNDIIRGGAGNDDLSGNAGSDLIWGGSGADTINGGDGDDFIVLIGTTAANAYSETAITSPAGQTQSLADLITLADVNDQSVSDAAAGETIDGGAGNNTLVIYGDVDLTAISLTNIDTLWVNSTVVLTMAQLTALSALIGDGASQLTVNSESGSLTLDLSSLAIQGIASLTIDDAVTLILSSLDDLSGIDSLTITGPVSFDLTAGSYTYAELQAIGALNNLEIASAVTLDLSGASLDQLNDLGTLSGAGTIILSNSLIGQIDGLTGVFFDEGLVVQAEDGTLLDVADLGGISASALVLGTPVSGSITLGNEQNFYAVTLVAGQIYQIDMIGSGSTANALVDPLIAYIYDANGDPIPGAFDDDGSGTRDSSMLFQPTESGTYYIAASSWGNETGLYQLSVEDVTSDYPDTGGLPVGPTNRNSLISLDLDVAPTGDATIDGLLYGGRYALDPDGTTTTITWSFFSEGNYSTRVGFGYDEPDGTATGSEPYVNFQELTAEQQALFVDIIDHVGAVVNITFQQVADLTGPVGSPGSAGNVRIGWTGADAEGAAAYASLPGGGPLDSDIWLLSESLSQDVNDPFLPFVMLHELGHALGLTHTFESDGSFGRVPAQFDSVEYSVMAYADSVTYTEAAYADLLPQTLMILDIRAMEYLYGLRAYNEGDTTYTYDGSEDYFLTLWDTGGNDTINFTGSSQGVIMDLSGDEWSDVGTTITYYTESGVVLGTRTATIYIPEEVSIENVEGTNFSDRINGGDADNILTGLEGNDYLAGGGGRDQLTGGSGADIFIVSDGEGAATKAEADMVFDFTDGEDQIGLIGLDYADLIIEDDGDDTLVKDADGTILFVLDNVDHTVIDASDFITLSNDWIEG